MQNAEKKNVYDPAKKAHILEPEPQNAVEKPKREEKPKSSKPKETEQPESKSAQFPVQSKINAYAFVHLSSDVQEAFGYTKGKEMPITIDLKDGKLIISKA